MDSIWINDTDRPCFEALGHDIKVEVLIIGGGLSGILCAHMLKAAGVDCALVEARRICGGITGNTTAKITAQHGAIYNKIAKEFDIDTARLYYKAQTEALDSYRRLCKNISCDFQDQDSYVYSLYDRQLMENETEVLNKIGSPSFFVDELPIPVTGLGAVCLPDQAQFNPLKFAFEIAKDLNIYENTKVLELQKGKAVTNRGNINAEKMIVATHFPFVNKFGAYFLKLYQHRSYVIALANAPETNGMYVDENENGLSFRSYNGLLLLGGGGHRTGKSGGGWRELDAFAGKYYPSAKIVSRWATQDCMSLDGIPYIGRYSEKTPDVFVATGFNKWGMTSSMVASSVLADMILEKTNEYTELFSPSRSIFRKQLALNAAESIAGIVRPTAPRCPHMGCALKYNKEEHSWDCSCHGSRFSDKGALINNPATNDLSGLDKKI
ncbi:MAG: FAD-dependent oxidoreductase [Clostridia bacterium]|nr:FAD-dependent oxidoreductase [Clostridia bacterium]